MAKAPTREEIVAMLATYGDRRAEDVAEGIDSLELAWLIHQLEQHYGTMLDFTDDDLARMSTVDGTLAVLRDMAPAETAAAEMGPVAAIPGQRAATDPHEVETGALPAGATAGHDGGAVTVSAGHQVETGAR
ncbi:hypothetical protein ACQP00_13310 [Dactylosporangium sp. CS-047395]|uniref:hypothetical protein n=1 Tax=Dactylosporangium sp. CS-047395 TaxID=3239936 RepID=UPI003D912F2E